MNNTIKIAIDAMGGDGSPNKIINGIVHHYKNNKDSFYQIFGDEDKINFLITFTGILILVVLFIYITPKVLRAINDAF